MLGVDHASGTPPAHLMGYAITRRIAGSFPGKRLQGGVCPLALVFGPAGGAPPPVCPAGGPRERIMAVLNSLPSGRRPQVAPAAAESGRAAAASPGGRVGRGRPVGD